MTGVAVLQRALHSDEDIMVFSFQRVIALTTIAIRHDLTDDLADRILLVERSAGWRGLEHIELVG